MTGVCVGCPERGPDHIRSRKYRDSARQVGSTVACHRADQQERVFSTTRNAPQTHRARHSRVSPHQAERLDSLGEFDLDDVAGMLLVAAPAVWEGGGDKTLAGEKHRHGLGPAPVRSLGPVQQQHAGRGTATERHVYQAMARSGLRLDKIWCRSCARGSMAWACRGSRDRRSENITPVHPFSGAIDRPAICDRYWRLSVTQFRFFGSALR